MSMGMIRSVVVQGMSAVQNAHDARLCELIAGLRRDGYLSNGVMINKLLELRRDMAGDTQQLQDNVQAGST